MTYQAISGPGPLFPALIPVSANSTTTSLLIDATGEKAAFVGRVRFPARAGTKNISRVQFRWGSITKSGGSGLTVSLQDVDLTAGPPGVPDGTQDQTVAVANGDSGFASNTWYRTGALGATRAVACGDLLSVVIEFDGAGRLGSDAVRLACQQLHGTNAMQSGANSVLFTSSWASIGQVPILVLEFDDGTFGMLEGSVPGFVSAGTSAINTGSSPNERGMRLQLPWKCKVDAVYAVAGLDAGADFDVVLYDASLATLATTSVDANTAPLAFAISTPTFYVLPLPAEVELLASTTYYLCVKPATSNNVSFNRIDLDNAGFVELIAGPNCASVFRTGGGAFTVIGGNFFVMGVRISQLDDGAGGGGPGGAYTFVG